jgi:hypothetical protein
MTPVKSFTVFGDPVGVLVNGSMIGGSSERYGISFYM